MQYFKHHQIDKEKWDRCIFHSKESIIYAFSWYLDCVSPNWEGFVLENEDEPNKEYLAVMPLPVQKKYGISFLQIPLFVQQLGVFCRDSISKTEFKDFLNLLQKHFPLVSNYAFNTTNYLDFKTELEETFQNSNSAVLKICQTHHLSLQQNYATIHQNYKRDTKYRIKQGEKQNFEVLKSKDITLLWQFFEQTVFLEKGISNQAQKMLASLFAILQEKKVAELVYIQNPNKEILSGILMVKSQANYATTFVTKWIYLFNAAKKSATNQKDESRRWFLDKFIQEKSENGYEKSVNNFENQSESQNKDIFKQIASTVLLDFESAQEKQVARFYESFGSEAKPFLVLDYNRLPFYMRVIQKIKHLIRQFFKR